MNFLLLDQRGCEKSIVFTVTPSHQRTTGCKQGDGMTRAPWSQGRSLVWDVTVVDTVAQSYVKTTKSTAGAAVDQAEEFKMQKYRILSDRYHFKPL